MAKELLMRVQWEQSRDWVHLKTYFTARNKDGGFEFLEYDDKLRGYNDLLIHSQGNNNYDEKRYLYGTELRYDTHHVDLSDCELMIKCLRKINRGLDKIQEQEGYPTKYYEIVSRVARITGVKGILFNTSTSLQSIDQRRLDVGPGINWIRRMEEHWISEAVDTASC